MNHVKHPLSSADISIFSPEIGKFCYTKKCRYRFHFETYFLILSNCFESLKMNLVHMVTILMRSAKVATLGLLEIKLFWSNTYGVISSVNEVTHKILSHNSNDIVDVVMWPKFGNCSISMRKVIITSIL